MDAPYRNSEILYEQIKTWTNKLQGFVGVDKMKLSLFLVCRSVLAYDPNLSDFFIVQKKIYFFYLKVVISIVRIDRNR